MKLLVLGASGGCGRWLVKLALERGHWIRAIVRPNTKFQASEGVDVIWGSVLNKDVLKEGLEGVDGVLSALGIKRKNPRNPWSPLASPSLLTASVSKMLVELMPTYNVKQFIGISAAGVGDSYQSVNPIIKWMIAKSNMKASYDDLEHMESIFGKSEIEWMAVRPVTLMNGKPKGKIKETNYYGLMDRIRRADVASFMLDQVEQTESFVNKTPMIQSV